LQQSSVPVEEPGQTDPKAGCRAADESYVAVRGMAKATAYETVCKNRDCGTKMLVLRFGELGDPIAERQAKSRADQRGVRFVREDAPDIITCPECGSVYGTVEAPIFPTVDPD
jgi:hypothetical protein